MTGVGQVHLGVGVRQTVGDQLQLQVLIVLMGTPYGTVTVIVPRFKRQKKVSPAHLPASILQAPSPADGGTAPS